MGGAESRTGSPGRYSIAKSRNMGDVSDSRRGEIMDFYYESEGETELNPNELGMLGYAVALCEIARAGGVK
jgi:hypothetical protein